MSIPYSPPSVRGTRIPSEPLGRVESSGQMLPQTVGRRDVSKGMYNIPASHISQGGLQGVNRLKGAGEIAAQKTWSGGLKSVPKPKAAVNYSGMVGKKDDRAWEYINGKYHPVEDSSKVKVGRPGDILAGSKILDHKGHAQAGIGATLAATGIAGGVGSAQYLNDARRFGLSTKGGKIGLAASAAGFGAGAGLLHRASSHQGAMATNLRTGHTYVAAADGRKGKRFNPPDKHVVKAYDPEDRRQRRLGMMEGGLGVTGVAGGVKAVKQIRADSRVDNSAHFASVKARQEAVEAHKLKVAEHAAAGGTGAAPKLKQIALVPKSAKGGLRITGKGGIRLAAAGVGLGGAAAVHRHANSKANARWY